MAHYRSTDFDYFYRGRSIGQLLLLDSNLIDYVLTTNPFGSSEDSAEPARGRPLPKRYRDVEPTPEVANQLAGQIVRGFGPNAATMKNAGKVDAKDLPMKVRILLGDMEKGRDARNRR